MDGQMIVYHDDASPGAIMVRKAMALKDLSWKSLVLHDADLTSLVQIFGSHPVLQIGADVYVGAEPIIEALERIQPKPTFFPNNNRGMPIALAFWARVFYSAVHELLTAGESEAAVKVTITHADLVERQIADGRAFLQGPTAGLADLHGYSALKGLVDAGLDQSRVFEACTHLEGWMGLIDALGEGNRHEIGDWQEASIEPMVPPPGTEKIQFRLRCKDAPWISGDCLADHADELVIALTHPRLGQVKAHYAPAFLEFRVA